MIEVKQTLIAKICAFKEANPSLSNKDIAAALNTSVPYVYQSLHPKGKKIAVEKADAAKPVDQGPSIEELMKKISQLQSALSETETCCADEMEHSDSLQKKLRDLQGVIRYLEEKIEDGLAV